MHRCVIVVFAALEKSHKEADAVKKQVDGLAREYDRLLKEHQELQVTQGYGMTGLFGT